MAFTSVPVTGTIKHPDGTLAAGAQVSFTLNVGISDGTNYVSPETITETCDGSGNFTASLYANDDATTQPQETFYAVKITAANKPWVTLDTFNIVVPKADVAGVSLLSLATLLNPESVSPFVSQIIAGTGVTLSPTGGTGAVTINASGGGGGLSSLTSPDSSVTIGGTLTAPTLEAGPSLVNISSFLGFSQVVRPSGDATGAQDLANINSALASGTNTSVYLNGNYTVNGSITIPSNKTLVLADAYVKLANAANTPIIVNPSFASASTPAASGIHIRGIGRAMLDYNGANQTASGTTPWNEATIMFVNVSNFTIRDIQFTNSIFVPLWMQACSNGEVTGVHDELGATDLGFIHADIGCSSIKFSNLSANGTFPDSVFSMNSVANSAFPAVSCVPFASALTGAARNITGLSWSNITLSSGTGMFNCFLDGSGACTDIDISNIHNTNTGTATNYEFNFGPPGFHLRTLPVNGAAVSGWRVNGYTAGGPNHTLIGLDTPMTDMQFANIRVGGTGAILGLIGNQDAPTGVANYYPQVSRLKFTDVDIAMLSGPLMAVAAGIQATDIAIENVRIGTANGPLLQNASDITGLDLSKVRVGKFNVNPFQSTGNEVGVVRDVQYNSKGSAVTAILPTAPTFKIQQPFPALASADATPLPVAGSEIMCANTKDPTGGAGTTGGRYSADGKAWNLVSSGNGVMRPGQIYLPLLFHYDAAAILGVANGANVAKWADSANNNALVQATSANQPTFVASDSVLGNRPSVAFNGTSSFIQNSLLTPVSNAQPFSMFVVYYFTSLVAGRFIVDMATTASGADGPQYYLKNASNTGVFNGTSSIDIAMTAATNTAYVACFTTAASHAVAAGENKAAYASLTTGSSGTRTITGITLGAKFDGSSLWGAVHIAECFCYGGLITSTDYATVAAGLAAKYGVTLV